MSQWRKGLTGKKKNCITHLNNRRILQHRVTTDFVQPVKKQFENKLLRQQSRRQTPGHCKGCSKVTTKASKYLSNHLKRFTEVLGERKRQTLTLSRSLHFKNLKNYRKQNNVMVSKHGRQKPARCPLACFHTCTNVF